MKLSYSDEQVALQDAVKRFCDKSYNFLARNKILESPEGFNREHWKLFGELGWLGAALPEDVGGFGGSAIENAVIAECFGRALVVEPFISCAVMAAQAVNLSGTTQQRKDLLEPLIKGELLLALAHTEIEAGGLAEYVATRASMENDGYVINGEKAVIVGAPQADKLIVSARTSGEVASRDGISLFLVDVNAPGVERKSYRMVDGSRAADVVLTNVQVGADALLGDGQNIGSGLSAVELAIDHAIVTSCAEACGAMESVLWMTRDYLKTRSQYGATLNTYQALQHRMSDMVVEAEMSRSMLYQALNAIALEDPDLRSKGISASKVLIGQRGFFVCSNAIQLHGGMGVTEEYMIGHYFKRLVSIGNQFGNTEFHLERFGRLAA